MSTKEDVKKTLARLSNHQSLLDILMEYEHMLDNCNLYAYLNWNKGELVDGPHIAKYWVTATWMYPYKEMPDPSGGMRLVKFGCKVFFQKDIYKEPVKIKGPESIIDPKSKQAKLREEPIWLVTIKMPRKFIDDGLDSFIEDDEDLEIEKEEETTIDTQGLEMDTQPTEPSGGLPTDDLALGMETNNASPQ